MPVATAPAVMTLILAAARGVLAHPVLTLLRTHLRPLRAQRVALALRDEIAAMDGTGPTARRARMRRFYFDHSRGF